MRLLNWLWSHARELALIVLALAFVRGCQLRDHDIDARATAEWRERSADSVLAIYKDSLAYANKLLSVRVLSVERWHVDTIWRARASVVTTHDTAYVMVPQATADSIVHEQGACEELRGTCALLQRSSLNTIQALRDENAALKARPERSCMAQSAVSGAVSAGLALWLSRR